MSEAGKTVYRWAGYVNGRIDMTAIYSAMHGYHGMLYPSKKAAQRMYSDVRRVRVTEVRKGSK